MWWTGSCTIISEWRWRCVWCWSRGEMRKKAQQLRSTWVAHTRLLWSGLRLAGSRRLLASSLVYLCFIFLVGLLVLVSSTKKMKGNVIYFLAKRLAADRLLPYCHRQPVKVLKPSRWLKKHYSLSLSFSLCVVLCLFLFVFWNTVNIMICHNN